jgi:hypothetical protein
MLTTSPNYLQCVRSMVADPDPHYFGKLVPDLHKREKVNPDPH